MKIMSCVALAAAIALLPGAAYAQGKTAPKDVKLYFITPRDGQKVRGGFLVRFGLRNMGVTHAGDDYQNAGHHHLLVDVNDPIDPKEPIPQDKSHLHFGAGQTETMLELPQDAHAATGAGRCEALPVRAAGRIGQDHDTC